ncbi:hypothetical protein, partial [Thermomonas sp.]|uniref:hypothetical protein n=1 Tax=Thermomonas sp. TaxID=1971895 RepID=UPI0026291F33
MIITDNAFGYPGRSAGEGRNDYAFAALRADGSVVAWGKAAFGGDLGAAADILSGAIDVVQVYSNY